jgi:very-short-patch-repair endonuclease
MNHEFARKLRKNMTDEERRLWQELRRSQLRDFKFRRQAPIGPFIADFVCFERKLIVELDGSQHAERLKEDALRTAWLTGQGFRLIRFWNNQIVEDLDVVLEMILRAVEDTPHPNPPPQGGRGPDRPPPQGGRETEHLRPQGGTESDGVIG